MRGCPSGVLAAATHGSAAKGGADFPRTQAGSSTSREAQPGGGFGEQAPSQKAPGESLEGSSPAGKPEMPLLLPHRQPEWASQSKAYSPGEGRQSLLPSAPTDPHTPLVESGERSCLVSSEIPISGGVRVPGNDTVLKRVRVGHLQGALADI